jgi:hypothetical protein
MLIPRRLNNCTQVDKRLNSIDSSKALAVPLFLVYGSCRNCVQGKPSRYNLPGRFIAWLENPSKDNQLDKVFETALYPRTLGYNEFDFFRKISTQTL